MSRRAIKRYEQAFEAGKLAQKAGAEENEDSKDEQSNNSSPHAPRSQGLFALLGDEEDDDSSADEADPMPPTEEADANPNAGQLETGELKSTDETQSSNAQLEKRENQVPGNETDKGKRKRRKKRKGKKKQGNTTNHETDPDWIALNEADSTAAGGDESTISGWIPSSYFAKDDNEYVRAEAVKIMATIEEIVQAEKAMNAASISPSTGEMSTALHVEPRHLNADSEMKRLFGSRVIESERRADEAQAAGTGRRRGRTGGRAHLRKKVSLVSPRETWYPEAPGLTMVLDSEATNNSTDGVRYYRYKYETSYSRIQDEYRVLVGTHDPNMLVQLMNRYPYHVDTLLQLAEVFRQMGELDRAAEMIERCLYILENAWNIGFKPYDGTCRLRFDILENRSLYVALFRYSQLLTRRGLHRTALEISKLLLNFDPERDPMGMLMLSDSFALLCGEYQWIQDMQSGFSFIPVRHFPNFAASAAIACESIRLGITGISNRGGASKGKKSESDGKTASQNGEGSKKAEELLTDALLTFPMLLRPLLSAVKDDSGIWMNYRLYDEAWHSAGYEDYGVLARMCRVYAERSKLLWNSTANKQLLTKCVRAAGTLDEAAGLGKDPKTGQPTSAFVSDAEKYPRVARCRALRAEAGEWLQSSGLYQSIQISDFADSTTNLPAEVLAGPDADQAVGARAPRDVTLTESAWEFLQSLLPWREASDAQQSNP